MIILSRLVLGIGLTLLAHLAAAQQSNAPPVTLSIVAQPMEAALQTFAKQSGLQVIFPTELAKDLTAPQIEGSFTPQAALDLLLRNSGLDYEFVNPRTVAIRSQKPKSQISSNASAVSAEGAGAGERGLKLAQVENTQRWATQMSESAERENKGRTSAVSKNSTDGEGQEVVVTGTQIRGIEVSTAPVIVLDQAYIDSTGISTTSRLIETLPQNFALANQSVIPSALGQRITGANTQGAAIDLRGIGQGTTLTLVNGRRMASGFYGSAVDISALPLTAVDRVEILTDGASAIYGSDAVGGVVNFILRRDFEGAETRLRSGWADGGVNEHRISQAFGHAWASGNALLSAEYYDRDLLPTDARDFVSPASDVGSLYPRDRNTSVLFTGRQDAGSTAEVFADLLYTNRDSYNEGGRRSILTRFDSTGWQVSAAAGLNWRVGDDWYLEVSASHAENNEDLLAENINVSQKTDRNFTIEGAHVKADGSLFALPGGDVRAAVGAEWRSETFEYLDPNGFVRRQFDQIVRSAFGELSVPLVGADNAASAVHRLQLSLAGRYDEYSNFGSSFDPKVGIMWEPVAGLRLRGSYGTSYVAPSLRYYNTTDNGAAAYLDSDPGAPGGVSQFMEVVGTDVSDLHAQEATNYSFGIDVAPASIPDLSLGVGYYSIEYRGRIAIPGFLSVMLGNSSSFQGLVIRDPSVAQVNDFIAYANAGFGFLDGNIGFIPNPDFDPEIVDVIVDTRSRNLSTTKASGLDVSLQYGFAALDGRISLALDGTYNLERADQITSNSVQIDTVGTIYNPPDWRVRASAGWQRQGWSANVFVNHTDSYVDNRLNPLLVPVSSYTVVDARLAYDFAARFSEGPFSGLTLGANIQNLFDRDPPQVAVLSASTDMGFDPTNANPMGRFIAVELVKTW